MGGQKVKGRKRHILVDTCGFRLVVVAHTARLQDRDGAELVFAEAADRLPNLRKVWADQAYRGDLEEAVRQGYDFDLEIVRPDPAQRGFVVQPKRWIVERTFGWLGRARRLSKDYEQLIESSEAVVYLASIHHLLKRLKPAPAPRLPYATAR